MRAVRAEIGSIAPKPSNHFFRRVRPPLLVIWLVLSQNLFLTSPPTIAGDITIGYQPVWRLSFHGEHQLINALFNDALASSEPIIHELPKSPKRFCRDACNEHYQLTFAGPGTSYHLYNRCGLQPILVSTNNFKVQLIAYKDKPIDNLSDLIGQTVVIPVTNLIAKKVLIEALLENGIDPEQVNIIVPGSLDTAIMALISHKAVAIVASPYLFPLLPEKKRKDFHVVTTLVEMPGPMVPVPATSQEQGQQYQRAVLDKLETTKWKGRFQTSSLGGLQKSDINLLERVGRYVDPPSCP